MGVSAVRRAEERLFAGAAGGCGAARAGAPGRARAGRDEGAYGGRACGAVLDLARGCEKQYKDREAALYTQLAEFFAAARAPEPDAGLDRLIELVERDLGEGYPALKGAAAAEGDRGTQRICVWGEKVTRILEALLKRYRSEGEAFLKDTKVWVCTVCGFVYVGDAAPQLCPVCKVPSWKFELV